VREGLQLIALKYGFYWIYVWQKMNYVWQKIGNYCLT
jgi:hypothetical protein